MMLDALNRLKSWDDTIVMPPSDRRFQQDDHGGMKAKIYVSIGATSRSPDKSERAACASKPKFIGINSLVLRLLLHIRHRLVFILLFLALQVGNPFLHPFGRGRSLQEMVKEFL